MISIQPDPMQQLFFPGEVIATEEEFTPAAGAFAEGGSIRSSLVGRAAQSDSKMGIEGMRDVRQYRTGMAVLGLATDDVRSVIFVKLDTLRNGSSTFVALKDGKVVGPKPDMRRMRGRGRGREEQQPQRPSKPMRVGDVVAALIIGEDRDSYTLSINMPDFGVVYSECGECGRQMEYDQQAKALVCRRCERQEFKKVSALYGSADRVQEMLKRYIKQ